MEVWWLCQMCGHDGYQQYLPDRCSHCGSFAISGKCVPGVNSPDSNFRRRLHDGIRGYVKERGGPPEGFHIEE